MDAVLIGFWREPAPGCAEWEGKPWTCAAGFALGLSVGLNSGANYPLGLPAELLHGLVGKGEPELVLVVAIFFLITKKMCEKQVKPLVIANELPKFS